MYWLDNVLAVPLIGVRVKPDFTRSAKYEELLGPLLNALFQKNAGLTIEPRQGHVMGFITPDGFQHRLTADDIAVQFKYPRPSPDTAGISPADAKRRIRSSPPDGNCRRGLASLACGGSLEGAQVVA
jgi:hypothetical protein